MLFLYLLLGLTQVQNNTNLAFSINSSFYDLKSFIKEEDGLIKEENSLNVKDLSAESVLVKEFNGKTLFRKNDNDEKDIASVTKLMSAYLGYLIFDQNTIFTFDQESINQEGEVGNFYVGKKISRNDLLKASLVSSSNDAIYLLAKTYGLEKFVQLMNEKAKEFGMLKTNFVDPTGLSKNLSTAQDLFQLIEKIYSRTPEIFFWTTLERININGKYLWTTNLLLSKYKSIIVGGKTGYKETTGENLVLILKLRNSPFVGVIILGSKDRFADAEKIIKELINYYGN